MGRIDLVLDKELEDEFRKTVSQRLGYRRGNLKAAVVEAIKLWMKQGTKQRKPREQ